jgi:hypothetical protein
MLMIELTNDTPDLVATRVATEATFDVECGGLSAAMILDAFAGAPER